MGVRCHPLSFFCYVRDPNQYWSNCFNIHHIAPPMAGSIKNHSPSRSSIRYSGRASIGWRSAVLANAREIESGVSAKVWLSLRGSVDWDPHDA